MPLTIQDFALVLGAPCQVLNNGFDNQHNGEEMQVLGASASNGMVEVSPGHWWMPADCLLILRPLSSLTEQEARELYEIQAEQPFVSTQQGAECLALWMKPTFIEGRHEAPLELATMHAGTMRWLLAHHFDLFGWIESGLAIKQDAL